MHQLIELAAVEADDGCHAPTTSGCHQLGASFHQIQPRLKVEHPCGIQRHQLTQAVTCQQRCLTPLLAEVVEEQ